MAGGQNVVLLLGYFIFGAGGVLCLFAAYHFFQNVSTGGKGRLVSRGIITSRVKESNNAYIITVKFVSRGGNTVQHQECINRNESWYEGKPVLIQYQWENNEVKEIEMTSYQRAYGKTIILCLLATLLFIAGTLLL